MTCAAIAALAGAVSLCPIGAMEHNPEPDCIVAAPDIACVARLCYHNHAAQGSVQGDHTVTLRGLSYRFHVEVGQRETVTLDPPPGYTVWPADDAEQSIMDGESATFCVLGGLM